VGVRSQDCGKLEDRRWVGEGWEVAWRTPSKPRNNSQQSHPDVTPAQTPNDDLTGIHWPCFSFPYVSQQIRFFASSPSPLSKQKFSCVHMFSVRKLSALSAICLSCFQTHKIHESVRRSDRGQTRNLQSQHERIFLSISQLLTLSQGL
jgi:hypothetical protein